MTAAGKRHPHRTPKTIGAAPLGAEVGETAGYPEIVFLIVALATMMLCLSVVGTLFQVNAAVVSVAAILAILVADRARSLVGLFNLQATALWCLIAAPFLIIPAISAFAPPMSWDEVAYSVTFPKLFSEAGRFYYDTNLGIYSAFPESYETLTTASLLLMDSITPVRLLGVVCFGALGGMAVMLARVSTRRSAATLLAGLLVLSAGVGSFAAHVKNDFANSAFQASALLFACAYLRRPDAKWLVLLGAALGTSGGIKYNSLQFIFCLSICLLPFFLRVAPAKERWKHIVVFTSAGVVAGAFWYARNIVVFGNPVYPFMTSLFGDGSAKTALLSDVVKEMFYGYEGFSYAAASPAVFWNALLDQFGAPVLILAAAGALILLLRLHQRSPGERRPVEFLILFTFAYSATCFFFGLWAPRYFIVLLVCYAALSAASLAVLFGWLDRTPLKSRMATWATACALGFALLSQTIDRQWRESAWLVRSILAGVDDEVLSSSAVNYWSVADWINKNTPACSKIGVGIDVQPYYYLNRDFYNFTPLSEDFLGIENTDGFSKRFRELGLTHIAIQDFIGRSLYLEDKNPAIYKFINGLYKSMSDMERDGSAILLAEIPGLQGRMVKFYRLPDNALDREASTCESRRITQPARSDP